MSEYTLTMGNGTNDDQMIYAHTGWDKASDAITEAVDPVSYTHLKLPTTP